MKGEQEKKLNRRGKVSGGGETGRTLQNPKNGSNVCMQVLSFEAAAVRITHVAESTEPSSSRCSVWAFRKVAASKGSCTLKMFQRALARSPRSNIAMRSTDASNSGLS